MSLWPGSWPRHRRALRKATARLTPNVLTYYPMEVFAGVVGMVFGLPLLLGVVHPTSLLLLLPTAAYWAYAVGLVLGSTVVGIGLRARHAFALASGMQLLSGCYIIYGIATVVISGWAVAWAAFACFTFLGTLCLVRSTHFRRLIDIQLEVSRREGG